jgi:predicted AAA+ superfamily ATPase
LNYFADTIWSPISLRNIKNASQNYGRETPSLTTLSSYISYLELPYLMYRVWRFDIHWKKMLEHNEKYYFNDLWIRNNLRIHMEMDIGKIVENMVYLHLRKTGYKVYVWNIGTKEIDFIAKKWNEIIYIQVAYLITDEQTRNREFDNLLEIKDAYTKIVVSTDTLASGKHKGIQWINIYDFIKNFK